MAYIKNAPFRADVVGSFLRPDVLKQALRQTVIRILCALI